MMQMCLLYNKLSRNPTFDSYEMVIYAGGCNFIQLIHFNKRCISLILMAVKYGASSNLESPHCLFVVLYCLFTVYM